MAQKILFVISHKLMPEQIATLQKMHGKTVVIERLDKRFSSPFELLEFHLCVKEIFDFIYYNLSDYLKNFLRNAGQVFRTLTRKWISSTKLLIKAMFFSTEKVETVLEKVFCKRTESKYYINKNMTKKRVA